MGYESRLYIVEKIGVFTDDNGKIYARVIAMFDMSKFYALSNVLRNGRETNCYFYADDGNTKVLEDCYGKPLTEATIKSVIEILEEEVSKGEKYWRIFPLLSTLKTFAQHGWDYDDIVVLHYGY